MKKFLIAGAAAAGLLCLAATPGSAQVARPDTALKTQMGDNIVQAQWRGGGFRGGGFHGGWGGGWRGGYYRGGGWGPAIGGLAAGAIIGGALAAPYYYGGSPYYGAPYYGSSYYDDGYAAGAPVYSGGGDVAYCMQRYRSYDPRSGTFLGYDGLRHPCP
ncbi:BA14K family protein [Beijerinckia sp. 28-YEA-48]|uniref:BA14K family protein n=1 Tax=unclassified Beijerinckia TaxID=2638183 RepID=UPI0008965B08|nr:hypothetical protein [Beijerinckia sp. GAS462]SEC76120.1 BA14K-like protein [Beijerinckia sp. 28-YEA-48]